MKKANIFFIILLIAVCVLGWGIAIKNVTKEDDEYKRYEQLGEKYEKDKLYQRAIQEYKHALNLKRNQDLYEKIVDVYEQYMKHYEKEMLEDFEEEYQDFLKEAVTHYPGNKIFVDRIVDIYINEKQYEDAYNCLKIAIDNSYDTKAVKELLLKVQYKCKERKEEYTMIEQGIGSSYIVSYMEEYDGKREEVQNIYNTENGKKYEDLYTFVGSTNVEGVTVLGNELESKIVNNEGMVMGIFEKSVMNAGVYAEGLIAAQCGDLYAFYDEFAKKQFGEYEYAGMFQNGKAAVKKDEKWMLVDKSGEVVSDKYQEIVVDKNGRYLIDGHILVKKTDKK